MDDYGFCFGDRIAWGCMMADDTWDGDIDDKDLI